MQGVRFRTLGYFLLTGAIESARQRQPKSSPNCDARRSQRQGQPVDCDEEAAMERKKREGYFW
jgi:sulfate adenylyltransferase subunit 2